LTQLKNEAAWIIFGDRQIVQLARVARLALWIVKHRP